MSKKAIIALTFCAIVTLIGKTTYCMSFNLTSSQMNEAIEYGKKNRRTSLKEFIKPWVVYLGEKTGWGTLYTAYHNVAFKARKAAIERRELSQGEILRALRIKESMTFTVSVFGDYMEFARGYNAILYSKDKTIYPVYAYLPDHAEPSAFYPDSPLYVAGCVYKFPIKDIDPNSEATLLVTSPEGERFKFVFELAKMK
ncbi:MAG: hypothetical protein ACE5KZ_00250 [Candidatus Scalinduaceae bacterium]